ncbi:MAG: hypothetical protein QOF41_2648 [Methylobacteriaceae bacterium]|nr:hypothetical protein [Methylobacteriaceae bacterium]
MANQLNLSSAEIAQIRSQVGAPGSVGQYSAAYRTVLAIDDAHRQAGLSALDDPTRYWFEQAVAINANDPASNANLFVREVTAAGLLLDGRSVPDLQAISNTIGTAVINQISDSGGVPPVGTLIANDISAAIQTGNQTVGGWGGAFYYWNEPYLTNPDGTTQQTVGQYIQSHPDEYETFIATNARALHDTLISDYSTGGVAAVTRDVVLGSIYAQVPANVAQEIATTAVYGNRTGVYAGDPDATNGWQRTASGVWQRLERFDPVTGAPETITADQATTATLEALRSLRVDPSYQDATRFSNLPNAMQGNMRGGYLDNNGSDVLQFADGQTGGTDNLIFNANNSGTLNGSSGQNLFIAAGNNQTVNESGSAGTENVIVEGSGGTVNTTSGRIEANFNEVPDDQLPTLTVHGPGNTVEEHRSAAVTVTGNNNTLNLDAGSSLNITGTGETISGDSATIATGTGSSINVIGSGDTVQLGASSYMGLIRSDNDVVYAENDQLATLGNVSFNLLGSGDTVQLGANSYMGLIRGDNETFYANNDQIATLPFRAQKHVRILAVTFGLGLLTVHSQAQQSAERRGSDASFRTVQFGPVTYKIPDIFLPGVTPFNKDKNYAAFTIGILLPEFKPAGTDPQEFRRTGWHNQLTALFEYGLHFRDEMEIVDETLESAGISKDRYQTKENGCRFYQGQMAVSNELYVCPREAYVIKITCDTRHASFPSCTVIENIGGNTTVIYHYSRKYVDLAVWIDDRIREQATTFAVTP